MAAAGGRLRPDETVARVSGQGPPAGLDERPAAWHHEKFVEFVQFKREVGEPSPHLAIVGHLSNGQPRQTIAWYLGCYGATYCLPSAQMFWQHWTWSEVVAHPDRFKAWLTQHWKGIITRTERRCVRTPDKMARCLTEYARWVAQEFPALPTDPCASQQINSPESYDVVWESVTQVPFIGRYIAIRMIEGLRRFCDVPASLYDVRSIGGWSPRKAMVYLYRDEPLLLEDTPDGAAATDRLARDLLARVQGRVPTADFYVVAAMLCEYRVAFENQRQYPGRTLDQKFALYAKAKAYWGDTLDSAIWDARRAVFPHRVLGELNGWNEIRRGPEMALRTHGYNWSDVRYNFVQTLEAGSWAAPVRQPRQRMV